MKRLSSDDIEKAIEHADDLMYERKSVEALKRLQGIPRRLLRGSPPELRYRFLEVLNEAYSENNMADKAIACCRRALRMNVQNKDEAFLYHSMGMSFSDLNDVAHAIQYLERALKKGLSIDDHRGYLLNALTCLASCYRDRDQYNKAISVNQRVIQEFYPPKNELELERIHIAYSELAMCYWQLEQEDKAEEYFSKVIDDPKVNSETLASVHGARGNYYLERNQFEKAIDHYRKAIEHAKQTSDVDLVSHWRKWLAHAEERRP